MDAMIALALLIWGWFAPVHIHVAETRETQYISTASFALGDTTAQNCVITVTPLFESETPANQQNAITHEVGHCLGLQHIDHPGVMNTYGGELSGWDMLELWRVHPKSLYRVTVPMLAH